MNLDQWHSHPTHRNDLAIFIESPVGKALLDTLKDQVPRGFPMRGQVVNSEMIVHEHGRAEGFYNVIDLLQQLTEKPASAPVDIQSTFE